MKIEEQFNLIASDYDKNRKKFIPCYDDFYETATKMILSGGKKPKRVLDLGAGTGLLTSFWVRENPLATNTFWRISLARIPIISFR